MVAQTTLPTPAVQDVQPAPELQPVGFVAPGSVVAIQSGTWVDVMKGAISKNAIYFNSLKMMRRYATEAYLR
jgi:hypothetical protein